MVTVTVQGTVEPLCCWLRPAPPDLDINLHCTYNQIVEVVRLQQWYPPNCHYCNYHPKHVDDYERHVVKLHPGRAAYPGPAPENVARALYIVESIERELRDRKIKNNRNCSRKTLRESSVANGLSDSLLQNDTVEGSESNLANQ